MSLNDDVRRSMLEGCGVPELQRQLAESNRREAELQADRDALHAALNECSPPYVREERDQLAASHARLREALERDIAKEERHIIDCGGPTGLRNSMASALGLARNSIRHEILRILTREGES